MIFFSEMRKHLDGMARAKNVFVVGGGVGFLLMLGLSIGIILLANAVKAADLPIPPKTSGSIQAISFDSAGKLKRVPMPRARAAIQSDRPAGMP